MTAQKTDRRFYLREFKAISRAFSTYEDLNLLVAHVVEGISRAFKVKGCCVMLYDDREKQLFRVASHGISDAYLTKGPVFFLDDRHSSFKTGEVVLIEDVQNDPRVQYPEEAKKEHIVSMLSLPIKCRNDIIGIIRIYHGSSLCLHEEDMDSLSVLALHLGLVIENNGLRNFLERVKMSMGSLPLRMLEGL